MRQSTASALVFAGQAGGSGELSSAPGCGLWEVGVEIVKAKLELSVKYLRWLSVPASLFAGAALASFLEQ